MNISKDVTATLRAQDHGHPPIVCLQGDGVTNTNKGCWSEGGVAYTLNTVDQHAVCYGRNDGIQDDTKPSAGLKGQV